MADELSPSRRYLLVGETGTDSTGTIRRLVAVELTAGKMMFALEVPLFSKVTWAGRAVIVHYAGKAVRMPLPGAGWLHGNDGAWRPLSR